MPVEGSYDVLEAAELSALVARTMEVVELPAAVWAEIGPRDSQDAVLARPDGVVGALCRPSELAELRSALTGAGSMLKR